MQDIMNSSTGPLLATVAGLALWHVIITVVAFASRLGAISAAKLPPEAGQRTGPLAAQLPDSANFKMDNYNHLFEQPTVFYAITLAIAVGGLADSLYVTLAWSFVGIRVVHSLNQMTVNHVLSRFGLFAIAWIVLGVMIVRSLLALLG